MIPGETTFTRTWGPQSTASERGARVRHGRGAALPDVGHDVHDRAAAAGREERVEAVAHVPGPREIRLDDGAPAVRRDVVGPGDELPAGAVHERVALVQRADELGDLLEVADIRRERL